MILGTALVTIWALSTFLEAMQYACDSSETNFCLEVKQTTSVNAQDNDSVRHPPFQGNVTTQKRRHLSNLLLGLRMSPKTTKRQSAISSNHLTIPHCNCVCVRCFQHVSWQRTQNHEKNSVSSLISSDQMVNPQSPQTITYQKISICRFATKQMF